MGIDDLFAAALLGYIMLRRLEVRTARSESFPFVPVEEFESWRKMVLSTYRVSALACVFKVVLTMGWFWACLHFAIRQPYYSAVPVAIFVVWVIVMVSGWQRASDAKSRQERLGIVLSSPKRNSN